MRISTLSHYFCGIISLLYQHTFAPFFHTLLCIREIETSPKLAYLQAIYKLVKNTRNMRGRVKIFQLSLKAKIACKLKA